MPIVYIKEAFQFLRNARIGNSSTSMVFLDTQAKGNQIRSRNFGWFAVAGILLSTYSKIADRIVQVF